MKYNKNKLNMLNFAVLVLAITSSVSVLAQDKSTLGIGDTAPEIRYSKWLKGTPVGKYEKDRLYVIEFWATWCGPCKQVMPHLSELAKKYQDKATFVGMNIWEKTGDKPYESCLPAVTSFVTSNGERMSYNVAVDNNAKDMVNNWMLPAGQNGIPSTFLLQDGKVLWIGNPIYLDSVMNQVIAGKYDLEAAKANQAADHARKAKYSVLEPLGKAYKAKEYEKVLAMIESADKSDPELKVQYNITKFLVFMDQKRETEAMAFTDEWIKEQKGMASGIASLIVGKDGLSKKMYLYAIGLYNKLSVEDAIMPYVHHEKAKAYAKAGQLKNAIAEEEKAIQSAKDALKEGKYAGYVLNSTVVEFEAALSEYKKKS